MLSKRRGEHHDASFADRLLEQQRSIVGQSVPARGASIRFDHYRLIEPHAIPKVAAADRRIGAVGISHGLETNGFGRGIMSAVGFQLSDRHGAATREAPAQHHQHLSAGVRRSSSRFCSRPLRQRCRYRETTTKANRDRLRLPACSTVAASSVKAGSRADFHGGLEVGQALGVVAGRTQEQRRPRIGPLDGEIEVVVVGKRIGAIDPHFAAIRSVAGVEGGELHVRAARAGTCTDLGIDRLAIQQQRDLARRRFGAIPCHRHQHARFLGIEDTPRRIDVLHREIRHHTVGFGMHDQIRAAAELQVGERRRHGRLLHIGKQMRFHRQP